MTVPRGSRLIAGLVVAAWWVSGAHAQWAHEGRLAGSIRNASGATLADASVLVRGPALIGGTRTTTTDADGRFRATNLAPGTYEIEATAEGYGTTVRRGLAIEAGGTLVVDVELQVAGLTETIVVDAPVPLVDVTSAAPAANLAPTMLSDIPTDRLLPSLLNLVPGIGADVAYGGTQGSNVIQVDGLETSEPRLQQPFLKANYNWVEEVQIAGLGASAEWGGFTGAAANNIVRSGSNRLSGLLEFLGTPPSWTANNTQELSEQLQRRFASREILSRWDANGQAGGPLLRDRLWLFAGFQRLTNDTRPPGYDGPAYRAEDEWRAIGKLTAAPSPATRLEGFVQGGRRRASLNQLSATVTPEAAGELDVPEISWNARLGWTASSRLVVDIRYAGWDSDSNISPTPPATVAGPSPHEDLVLGVDSGNVWYWMQEQYGRQSVSAVATAYADGFLGRSHDVKFGVEFERTRSRFNYGIPGGRAHLDMAGEPYELYDWGGSDAGSRVARTSVFAQDRWALTDRLTLSPGIRVDVNRGGLPDATTSFSTTPVSWRLGLAWDARSDHRTVLRAHYGRYTDPAFGLPLELTDPDGITPLVAYRVQPDGSLVEVFRSSTVNQWSIGDDLRQPYVDQVVLGAERALGANLSVQAHGIYRLYEDFLGQVDTTSIWAPVQAQDPGPDGRLGTADDGAMFTVYSRANPGEERFVYENPPDAWRRYAALQLVARRRYARGWQLQASYTRSKAWGTVSNRWHTNASRFDLGNPGLYVNPNMRINADGRANFDPLNEFKALGSVRLPWAGGVTFGGVYRYNTGYAWGREAQFRTGSGNARVKVEPRGARRAAPVNLLDLRVEKQVSLGASRKLGVYLDVFNVANVGTVDSTVANAIVMLSGANLGTPQAWVDPRTASIGARLTW